MFTLAIAALAPIANADDATQPASKPSNALIVPAESGTSNMEAVVVTANRLPTPTPDVGSSFSLITADEIQQKQQPLVSDVLRGTPGLDVVRSGGPNQITSAFLRGSNSDHTLVLIDGIEANDPSSPSRAFDFSTLTVDDIDRIEVLRGPQSTLWGSNAIGGVINIITKRGEGPPTGYFSAEGGSFNTFRESAGISGGTKFVNYSLNVTQADSQGFPAADAKFGNTTPDGYNNQSIAGRIGVNLSSNFDVDIIARYQHNRVRIDDGGGPHQDDPNRFLKSQQEYFRVQPHVLFFDGVLEQTYGFNYTRYVRDDTSAVFGSHYQGTVYKFDFQNNVHISKTHTLSAGVDLIEEGFAGTGAPQKYANSAGIFLQDKISFNDALFLTGGVRYDDNSLSSSDLTYRFTAAYLFPTETRLHSSYGTGFKSPSLSDIYSSFGSRDLKAEKSDGFDVGIEQGFFNRVLVVDATYFNNKFRDLISYDFIANREQNIGEARSQGAEIGAALKPWDPLTIGVNYTYTDTEDESTHLELLRRPRNKVGGYLNYRYSRNGSVTLSGTYVSSRADIDPVSFGRTRVGSYVLVNLSTAYRITDHLELTARIDNLLNQHYEEVAGFGTADFSLYGGIKLTF